MDNEDDESEALAPAANASPATPPRKNPDKETPENNDFMDDRDSPLSEEAVGDACAAAILFLFLESMALPDFSMLMFGRCSAVRCFTFFF